MNPPTDGMVLRLASAYIAGMALSRQLESVAAIPAYNLAVASSALAFLTVALIQLVRNKRCGGIALYICSLLAGAAVYVHRGDAYDLSLPAIGVPLMGGITATSLPEHAAFINSILFGASGPLDPNIRMNFAKSGIVHVLSVSGLHVAFVAAFTEVVLRPFIKRRGFRVALQMAAIGIYALVCGAKAPVTRSALMLGFGLVAGLSGRPGRMLSGMAFSAMIVASLDPDSLFTPSFQLSYITVFSLAYLGPILKNFWPGRLRNSGSRVLTLIGDSICLSLAATIGSAPLLAYYFGEISLVSPVANLPAVPLSGAIVILGLIQSLSFLIFPLAAMAFGATNGVLVDLLIRSADICSHMPFAQIVVRSPSAWMTMAFYLFIFWVAGRLSPGYFRDKIRRASAEVALVGASAILIFCVAGIISMIGEVPSMTFINVRQGDSILIESSDKRRMLVDAGPIAFYPRRRDAGERYVVPFLHKRGVRSLDAVLFTHSDSDHIGGGMYILGAMPVGAVFRKRAAADSELAAALEATIRARGVKDLPLKKGDVIRLGRDVVIEVLSPYSELCGDSDNNGSIVLMVKAKGHKALLTGDIEAETEGALVDSGAELDCDVLKVAHHGSKSSSTEPFLRAATPSVSVVSVGHNNFGHPSAAVLARLRRAGSQVRRTDTEGNITVDMPAGPLRVVSERKRRTAFYGKGRSIPVPREAGASVQQ